ncbi:MAG: hypothetical protein R8P61_08440 [Bacteroidia bacterium]|nr:hypothetical protein [Bacteroidia bacterium]
MKRFKFSLFLLALVACLSCESDLKVNPADALESIDESMLEPVDISFDEIEGTGLERFLTEGESCDKLARIRKLRREGECRFMIELRSGKFVNPINPHDLVDLMKNGRFLRVSLERAEEGPCDRGIPAYVYCASSLNISRDLPSYEDIKIERGDGN